MTARKRAGTRRPREKAGGRPRGPAAPRLLVLALALGLGLRALASLLPVPGVWGLDTLRVWPRGQAIAVLLLGAAGFVPAVARALEHAMDAAGALAGRAGIYLDAALGLGVGLALYRLPDPVRWVGDLSTRVGQLVLDAPIGKVFPQAAPLDRWINIMIPRRIMAPGTDVNVALHFVGAFVGGLFAVAALSYLRATGAARGAFVALVALVFGGGYMLHFAGYDKFGPLLVGIALAAYGVMRLAREGRGAWAVGAGVVVCLLSHRSGYAVLPAAAWALVQGFRRPTGTRARIEALAAGAAIVATAAVMLPRALHLLDTIDRVQNLTPPPLAHAPAATRALADAATRGGDALNLLFFLAPLWLAGVAAAWLARPVPAPKVEPAQAPPPTGAPAEAPARAESPARNGAPRFSLAPVALLAILPEAAILLVARGAQGVMRDWDMHVGAALVITLASAAALLAAWRGRGEGGSLAPVLTTALASALALWGTQVSAPRQLARIQLLLSNRAVWSDAAWARAHDFLGVRALQAQRYEEAIRELQAAAAVAPNPRFFFQIGLAQRGLERSDLARASFEKAQALDHRLADAWVGFALLAFDDRDWHRVIACAESALVIAPHRRDAKEMRDNARRALDAGL
ncbi:MAG TPA: tetratricopeptide repeat protein [Candidatus Eisenbacteria bacterium]